MISQVVSPELDYEYLVSVVVVQVERNIRKGAIAIGFAGGFGIACVASRTPKSASAINGALKPI